MIQFIFMLSIGRVVIGDLLNAFWNMRSDGHWFFPVNGTLWFLRELFIVSILFPLPLLIVRYVKPLIGLPVLALFSVLLDYKCVLPGTYNAFIYFTIGAYVGYYKIVILDLCRNYRVLWSVLYAVIVIADLKYYQVDNGFLNEFHRLGFFVGSFAVLGYTCSLQSKYKGINLPSLAMFIFLSHSMLRTFPMMISYKIMSNLPAVAYMFNIISTLVLCFIVYMTLKKILNDKLFGLLIGGR